MVEFREGKETNLHSFAGKDGIENGEFDLVKIIADTSLSTSSPVPGQLTVEPLIFAPDDDAAFTVLDKNGERPPAYKRGRKDTVFIPNGTTVRLAVDFGNYPDPDTPYMYHCHLLYHEDSGMMGQFVIVAPGTESQVPRQLTAGHHHYRIAFDRSIVPAMRTAHCGLRERIRSNENCAWHGNVFIAVPDRLT